MCNNAKDLTSRETESQAVAPLAALTQFLFCEIQMTGDSRRKAAHFALFTSPFLTPASGKIHMAITINTATAMM